MLPRTPTTTLGSHSRRSTSWMKLKLETETIPEGEDEDTVNKRPSSRFFEKK